MVVSCSSSEYEERWNVYVQNKGNISVLHGCHGSLSPKVSLNRCNELQFGGASDRYGHLLKACRYQAASNWLLLQASLRLPPPTECFRKILWEVGLWIDRFASLKKSFEAISSNTTTPGKSSCPGVQNMLANFHAQTLKNVAGSCALNFDATDLPHS